MREGCAGKAVMRAISAQSNGRPCDCAESKGVRPVICVCSSLNSAADAVVRGDIGVQVGRHIGVQCRTCCNVGLQVWQRVGGALGLLIGDVFGEEVAAEEHLAALGRLLLWNDAKLSLQVESPRHAIRYSRCLPDQLCAEVRRHVDPTRWPVQFVPATRCHAMPCRRWWQFCGVWRSCHQPWGSAAFPPLLVLVRDPPLSPVDAPNVISSCFLREDYNAFVALTGAAGAVALLGGRAMAHIHRAELMVRAPVAVVVSQGPSVSAERSVRQHPQCTVTAPFLALLAFVPCCYVPGSLLWSA